MMLNRDGIGILHVGIREIVVNPISSELETRRVTNVDVGGATLSARQELNLRVYFV